MFTKPYIRETNLSDLNRYLQHHKVSYNSWWYASDAGFVAGIGLENQHIVCPLNPEMAKAWVEELNRVTEAYWESRTAEPDFDWDLLRTFTPYADIPCLLQYGYLRGAATTPIPLAAAHTLYLHIQEPERVYVPSEYKVIYCTGKFLVSPVIPPDFRLYWEAYQVHLNRKPRGNEQVAFKGSLEQCEQVQQLLEHGTAFAFKDFQKKMAVKLMQNAHRPTPPLRMPQLHLQGNASPIKPSPIPEPELNDIDWDLDD